MNFQIYDNRHKCKTILFNIYNYYKINQLILDVKLGMETLFEFIN